MVGSSNLAFAMSSLLPVDWCHFERFCQYFSTACPRCICKQGRCTNFLSEVQCVDVQAGHVLAESWVTQVSIAKLILDCLLLPLIEISVRIRFDEAWYFSRSAKADVTALYKLARSSSEATLTSMVCMRKRGGLRIWILAFLGVTFGVFFGLLRRFRPKKKQFWTHGQSK